MVYKCDLQEPLAFKVGFYFLVVVALGGAFKSSSANFSIVNKLGFIHIKQQGAENARIPRRCKKQKAPEVVCPSRQELVEIDLAEVLEPCANEPSHEVSSTCLDLCNVRHPIETIDVKRNVVYLTGIYRATVDPARITGNLEFDEFF